MDSKQSSANQPNGTDDRTHTQTSCICCLPQGTQPTGGERRSGVRVLVRGRLRITAQRQSALPSCRLFPTLGPTRPRRAGGRAGRSVAEARNKTKEKNTRLQKRRKASRGFSPNSKLPPQITSGARLTLCGKGEVDALPWGNKGPRGSITRLGTGREGDTELWGCAAGGLRVSKKRTHAGD